MIELFMNNERVAVRQYLTHPSVYLDHWALLEFSENEALGNRLTQALKTSNGTLAFSWLNLLEFSRLTDAGQARKTELLLDRNLPRLFCLDIQPFRVISREDAYRSGSPAPHSNDTLLEQVVCGHPVSPTSVYPFSAHNLFLYSQDPEFAKKYDELSDTAINRIEAMREELSVDASFESLVRRIPTGPTVEAGTRYVLRELLRGMLLNRRMTITRNHAIDLFHAVVPVSYCNFVLLDRNWETQVAQMRARVSRSQLSFPIAEVFSRKANGLTRFLDKIETFS